MICHKNHQSHETKIIDVNLHGRKVDDAPFIHSNMQFKMEVYDWVKYGYGTNDGIESPPGYCPGKDNVSEAIDTQGIWEAHETALILDILKEDGIVMDFGCHIGWYSIISAMAGKKVIAFDGVSENIDILKRNAILNNVSIEANNLIIDDNSNYVFNEKEEILLLKSDLEGSDHNVIRMCQSLFYRKMIHYAIVEVSPVFNDSYPAMIKKIIDYGYRCYDVPDKLFKELDTFGESPLEATKKFCEVSNPDSYIKTLRQSNFLLIR